MRRPRRRFGRELMKTSPPGLSDSFASVLADLRPCPHCNSSSNIAGGLCVGCLLQAGLDPADDCESESLTDILAEVHLPDQSWRLGNYEILEEIGRGGMGVIYRARQRHSRRIVAVKRVLSYHSDSRETLARFRREAQAAASLDHPNILPIYEVSESEDGLPFFSMKFAPGGSLQQMAPALRDDPRQCVALVAKITRAVQYAHSKGILHRDLKPGNILLDGRGEPLVSDFGLAKWLDTSSDLTRTLTIFGTPGYIAPEQASHAAADLKPTADIYSLGAILFDLLAGRPPFLGTHALSVIRQAAESPAPKLRTLSKLADRDLETICSRCLDRDPKLRYPSAHDLAEDLERWLEGRPIIARRVLPPVRVWRWSKRNPIIASAGAACIVLTALVAARQIEARRLHIAVHAQSAVNHSVQLMPLFDLDAVAVSDEWTDQFARELEKQLTSQGPALVGRSDVQPAAAGAQAGVSSSNLRTRLSLTRRDVNGRLRFSLRLTDARNDNLLWQQIEEGAADTTAASIARAIAVRTYRTLDAANLTSIAERNIDAGLQDPEAKNFITSGLTLAERRSDIDLERSITCLEHAIELQPTSAAAHAALAKVLTYRVAFTSNRTLLPKAEEAALKAIALNPQSGEGHHALAVTSYHQGKFQQALEHVQQAFEYSGIYSRGTTVMAITYRMVGRPDKALAWLMFGRHEETQPADTEAVIGDCWAALGDNERAEAAYRHYSRLRPEQPDGWIGRCHLLLLNRRFEEARALYKENWKRYGEFVYSQQMAAQVEFFARNFAEAENLYAELARRDPNGGGGFYGALSYDSALGVISLTNNRPAAIEILERARVTELGIVEVAGEHPEALYRLAAVDAALGEKNLALQHLERAFKAGFDDYRSLQLDPRIDLIRDDEAYRQILERMVARVASLRHAAITYAMNLEPTIVGTRPRLAPNVTNPIE